jgi:hypothetical protein
MGEGVYHHKTMINHKYFRKIFLNLTKNLNKLSETVKLELRIKTLLNIVRIFVSLNEFLT